MMPSRPQPQPDMVYLHWYGRPETGGPECEAHKPVARVRATGGDRRTSTGARRGGLYDVPCGGQLCGLRTSHSSRFVSLSVPLSLSGHALAAPEVSIACRSFASSAVISPIATRSSGLMNPSLIRKPFARAIASPQRYRPVVTDTRDCEQCGTSFVSRREQARICSP